MKRTITTTLAALAMFSLTACKGGGGAAATKFIPEQASIIGGVDVAGLMSTNLYSSNKDKMMSDDEAKEMMEAAKGCNIDYEKFNSVVFGTDGDEGVAVVISGAGIGVEANLTCIANKVKEKKGEGAEAPFTVEGKEIKMAKDDGVAYIISDSMVAVASKPWGSAVKDLVDGKGKSALDGANKDIFAKADKGKHIWFAGKVPEKMAKQAEGLVSIVGSLDFSGGGLAVDATGTFASAEAATKIQDMAKGGLAMGKGMAEQQGIPGSVIDGIKIEAKDADLNASVKISKEDMETINSKLGALAGAM